MLWSVRNIFKFLLPLLLLAGPTWAATCVSAGSGNWGTAETWTSCGGVAPTATDTCTIATGHTVTSAATTDVCGATTINGYLRIPAGTKVTLSGNATIANSSTGPITGRLRIEGDAGGSGELNLAGGAYNLVTNTNTTGGSATFEMSGTAANRAKLVGGTGLITQTQATGPTTVTIDYADITGFTSASANQLAANSGLHIANTYFHGTSAWTFGNLSMAAGTNVEVTGNDFRTITPISNNLVYFQKADATSSGTRTITGNTFVGDGTNYTSQTVAFRGIQGFTLSQNVFYNARAWGILTFHGNTWDGNIVGADATHANWTDKISLYIGRGNTTWQNGVAVSTTNNWHGVSAGNAADAVGMSYIQDSVFEGTWTNPNSTDNVVLCDSYNGVTVQRNLLLGATAGILPAGDNPAANNVYIRRNTFANFNPGGGATATKFYAVLSEIASRTGGDVEFTSNMVYNNGSNLDNVAFEGVSTAQPNLTSGDYNAFYGFAEDKKYANVTGSFGTNDVAGSVDPKFKTPSANILSFTKLYVPAATTITDYLSETVKRNGFDKTGSAATFNSAFTAASTLAYLRTAFTPTNAALRGKGASGVDIGAVDVAVKRGGGLDNYQGHGPMQTPSLEY